MYSITVPEVYLCLYNEENGIWIHKMKKGASNKMKGYREAYQKSIPIYDSGFDRIYIYRSSIRSYVCRKGIFIFMGCAYEYSCICRFRTVSCCEFFCSRNINFPGCLYDINGNIRHVFYGFLMERFNGMGKKMYMIFSDR